MKASTVIAVAAGLTAYTVSAQLDQLPSCALNCAISSLGQTGCPTTDIACICKATSFITALTPCVQSACSAAEFETTLQAAGVLCQSAGVTLSVPVPGATTTTAAPSSSEPASTTTSVVSTTETVVEPPMTNTTTTSTEDSAPMPTNGTTVEPPTPSGTDGSSASRNAVALGGLGALAAFVAALL